MQKNSLIAIFLIIIMALSTTLSPVDQLESNDVQGVEGRQNTPLITNFTQFNQDLQDLNDRWSLQGGLQAAVFHNGSLVYANSFGNAVSDNTGQILMQNHHQMRIASLSKAITAAAIQTLVVSGDITLNDKMIDLLPEEQLPGTLEGCEYPQHSDQYLDAGPDNIEGNDNDVYWGIHNITVSHLINMRNGIGLTPTNTTNWHYANHWVDDSTSWDGANNACIDHESVAEEYDNGFLAPVKIETTIRETLRLPMSSIPGTEHVYSNIGYRILGEIIEEASGLEYEDYVKQYVLEPMGINNLQLGKSLLADKAEDEVIYYDRFGTTSVSFFPLNTNDGSNEVVDFGDSSSTPKPYGGRAPMEELAASGGWIANAISYGRFISYLDGTLHHPNFDDSFNFTINNPFFTSTSGAPYGAGIYVNLNDNSNGETWWHTGSLPSFTSTKFDRKLVHDEPVVVVLLTNSAPGSDQEITVNGQNLEWWEDRRNVMQTAFTTIDYQNLDTGRDSDRPLVYDESSPCPPGTSEQGSGAHIILFGPPQMKCYYIDQMGKKGPVFDEEKGWQKCPEGTSTSGVGDPNFYLWNEGGGYIICYLDEELHPEEEPCPEGEVLNDDNRCVKESRAINSVGAVWTIVCILWAVLMSRRYRIN
ncbi:MAG TPA: class A beta-lactamase-related serine hydrolase [Candidatus Poseidoniales archaeon]|nr:MAG TPA: class A beta-lactamase-related serine hydrolase [Candidatus Poseidoniales archaeon]HII49967.1 beta-lactamase family protein [Candidatus Poseidoniaceae archaeon]